MEPNLVPYSPILHRPPLRWPNGARVALWVVPNIEHYEYLPKFVRTRDPWPRSPHPDVLGYTQRDYGNRVGLWRLFEVTDALGIRCTVSLNMAVLEHFPEILGAMEARSWEYMSHGIYNTRYHLDFSRDEERAAMEESKDIHLRLTGRRLRGWFSPAITNTLDTFELAAACGYDYTADLYHDDQPFPLNVKVGKLISMPYSVDINDVILHRRGQEADDFARQIRDYLRHVVRGRRRTGTRDVHRAASLLGRPAASHPRVPRRDGIHPVASRCLAHHCRRNHRLVQRASSAADRIASRGTGGGQWLNPRTRLRSASSAAPAWIIRTMHSAR